MARAEADGCSSMSDETAATFSWHTGLPTLGRSSIDKSPLLKRPSHFLTKPSEGQSFPYDFCIDSKISFLEAF